MRRDRALARDNTPCGSRFKGYEELTIQDCTLATHNTCYRLERWEGCAGNGRFQTAY